MSNYWDKSFLKHLEIDKIKTIFEVGARYGDESINLKNTFPSSKIYSFECNPNTVKKCKKKLNNKNNIYFFDFGLGDKNTTLPFYSYIKDNYDGPSSFLKRIDFKHTQKQTGLINIKRLDLFLEDKNIDNIDLLCMDVQGYELNVLKGSGNFIKNINYIIMEEPSKIINSKFLPKGMHSKYINAPSHKEIKDFIKKNNFKKIERIKENAIEDNVMYKNMGN